MEKTDGFRSSLLRFVSEYSFAAALTQCVLDDLDLVDGADSREVCSDLALLPVFW